MGIWADYRADTEGGLRFRPPADLLLAILETRRVVAPSGAVPVESEVLLSRMRGTRKAAPRDGSTAPRIPEEESSRYVARPFYARISELSPTSLTVLQGVGSAAGLPSSV